ncbi:MAG: hypothetical protein RIS43_564 [Actinomycetota bacterium]
MRMERVAKILASIVVGLTVVSGIAGATVAGSLGSIRTDDVNSRLNNRPTKNPNPTEGEPINVLVIGTDTRIGQGKYFGDDLGGSQRSDTVILVHIAGNRKWATAVSLPRDTWVDSPDCLLANGKTSTGGPARFNVAFGRGGASCTIAQVEAITGVYIDHFVLVNFTGVQNIVNSIGGVEVCLTQAVKDKDSKLDLPKGITNLDGRQALSFLRVRHNIADGSDISRIRRQQDFLASLTKKVMSAGTLLNPIKLVNLLNSVADSLTTDPAIGTLDGMKDLAIQLQDLKPSTVRFITAPNSPNPANKATVVFNAKATELFAALRDDTQWPKPPDTGYDGEFLTVKPSAISMQVVNGTSTVGLAKKKATLLRSIGFKVKSTTNTTEALGHETTVWATAKNMDAARTVAKSLGLNAVKTLSSQKGLDAGIVVVVGDDFTDPVDVTVKSAPKAGWYAPTEGRAADEVTCSPA